VFSLPVLVQGGIGTECLPSTISAEAGVTMAVTGAWTADPSGSCNVMLLTVCYRDNEASGDAVDIISILLGSNLTPRNRFWAVPMLAAVNVVL
jgi:hypothetical protein